MRPPTTTTVGENEIRSSRPHPRPTTKIERAGLGVCFDRPVGGFLLGAYLAIQALKCVGAGVGR